MRRNRRGRFTTVRTSSRWERIVCLGISGGILFGIMYDVIQNNQTPIVYAKEEVVVEPQEVRIRVHIDWTTDRVAEEIAKTFPNDPVKAVAVGKSESGASLKIDAYNPEWHYDKNGNPICQGSFGVMQIACVHHIKDPTALFDVEFNLAKAKQIHEERGWLPWGGYTSGGYKKYME